MEINRRKESVILNDKVADVVNEVDNEDDAIASAKEGSPAVIYSNDEPVPSLADYHKKFGGKHGVIYHLKGDVIEVADFALMSQDPEKLYGTEHFDSAMAKYINNRPAGFKVGGKKPWIPEQHPKVSRKERRRLKEIERKAHKKSKKRR